MVVIQLPIVVEEPWAIKLVLVDSKVYFICLPMVIKQLLVVFRNYLVVVVIGVVGLLGWVLVSSIITIGWHFAIPTSPMDPLGCNYGFASSFSIVLEEPYFLHVH